MSKLTGSKKATQFTESVIREMTRLNQLHGGVNLSQGFPDFAAPSIVFTSATVNKAPKQVRPREQAPDTEPHRSRYSNQVNQLQKIKFDTF